MNDLRSEPAPTEQIHQIHALARDLAYGALVGDWSPRLHGTSDGKLLTRDKDTLSKYLSSKWNDHHIPDMDLLVAFGYVQLEQQITSVFQSWIYALTDKAFALLEQPAPASIFISYRRQDSSELALLVLARFKMLGQQPFLDLNIEPGDDWDTRIRREVTEREHFVSLVGPTTLESAYVRQEILWALDAGAQIIPIWHRGFGDDQLAYFDAQYPDLDAFFARQAIRVERENPIAYEGAIIQLLNRFGFTPS